MTYGTRHSRATILATELCVRSMRLRTPHDWRLNTIGRRPMACFIREDGFCHRRLPEARFEMIAGLRLSRFDAATPLRAVFHAIPDHERELANRAVDLTTGKWALSMGSLFDVPPLRHRACKKQSRPSAFTVHPCIPHAPPPVAGHRGRSAEKI